MAGNMSPSLFQLFRVIKANYPKDLEQFETAILTYVLINNQVPKWFNYIESWVIYLLPLFMSTASHFPSCPTCPTLLEYQEAEKQYPIYLACFRYGVHSIGTRTELHNFCPTILSDLRNDISVLPRKWGNEVPNQPTLEVLQTDEFCRFFSLFGYGILRIEDSKIYTSTGSTALETPTILVIDMIKTFEKTHLDDVPKRLPKHPAKCNKPPNSKHAQLNSPHAK